MTSTWASKYPSHTPYHAHTQNWIVIIHIRCHVLDEKPSVWLWKRLITLNMAAVIQKIDTTCNGIGWHFPDGDCALCSLWNQCSIYKPFTCAWSDGQGRGTCTYTLSMPTMRGVRDMQHPSHAEIDMDNQYWAVKRSEVKQAFEWGLSRLRNAKHRHGPFEFCLSTRHNQMDRMEEWKNTPSMTLSTS